MFMNPAKMAEPIEMAVGGLTQVSPRKNALDGDPDLSTRRGNFVILGLSGPLKRESLLWCVQQKKSFSLQ